MGARALAERKYRRGHPSCARTLAWKARENPEFGGAVVGLCHVLLNVNQFAYVD